MTDIQILRALDRIGDALEQIAQEGVVVLAYTKAVEPECDAAITVEQQIEGALAQREANGR